MSELELHEKLKAWLESKNKKRTWLADKLSVSKTTVSKWMTGRGKIAPAYQVLIRQLIADNDSTPTNSPSAPSAALSHEELTTAAQSIGKSPSELVRGVLYSVSDKIASDFEENPPVK